MRKHPQTQVLIVSPQQPATRVIRIRILDDVALSVLWGVYLPGESLVVVRERPLRPHGGIHSPRQPCETRRAGNGQNI